MTADHVDGTRVETKNREDAIATVYDESIAPDELDNSGSDLKINDGRASQSLGDTELLECLETIFRHHRHHNLSSRLVTQTVDEFLAHDISKIVLDQCAIKQFHKLDGMDPDIAEISGLNHAQMRFAQNAVPGDKEKGYSQALLGVDGEYRGIEVRALPQEMAVIENETTQPSSANKEADSTAYAGDDRVVCSVGAGSLVKGFFVRK